MLKTGKDLSQGQAFHRRLLSEYNTDITLDNYVSYFELKPLAKKIEHIRHALESKYRDRYTHRSGSNSDSTKACAVTPLRPPPCAASEAVTPTTRGEGKSLPTPSALGAAERQSSVSTAVFVDPLSPLFFKTRGFTELQSTDTALAELIRSRIELQEAFFEKLHESYLRVKRYIMSLERDFVDAAAELRTFDELHIRNELPRDYIPALYLKLEVMLKYRALNLMAFRKILKKFLERCACDSLELQQRVTRIDELIHVSRVSQPSMDLRSAALDLIAVYGTAFRLTYEQAVGHMREYENRTGVNAQRILPNSETFFVADAFPHNERPGNFAARVLAGSCSVFCEKMITEVLQCPRYPGNSCSRFANGEVSVNLQGPVRGDDVFVVQSMVALESENLSNAGALMELVLLIHSVQLAAAARITAVVPYLAYTRNAASISAVAEMIESAGCHHVVTVDMHSEQVEGMFSIPMESISATYEFVRYISDQLRSEGNAFNNITVVAPTGEFLGRAKEFADVLMRYNHLDSSSQFVSVCTAVRRVETRQSACTSRGARQDCDAQRTTAVVGGGGGSHGSHPSAHTDAAAASLLPCHHTSHQQHHHPPPHSAHKSQPLPAPTSRSAECGTPNSSGVASVATSQLLVNSPVGGGYAALYPHSPTTPNAGDAVASELVAVVGGESPAISLSMTSNYPGSGTITTATLPGSTHGALLQQQQQQQQQSYHHFGSSMPRSSSTLGMERALRLHEEGRQAVITRKEEATRNEYKKYVLVGDVKDRLCIMIETVIDEAVTIAQVARCLHEHGAARIILVATHAVMSGKAAELLINSPIELVVVTDSVNQDELMKSPALARKLRVVPIAPLLARAIEKIHTENTLATLFDKS